MKKYKFLSQNIGVYISIESKHRLSNPSENLISFIEARTEYYLGGR